ncbi:hypothetical protein FIE12Z_970 [Fusarium flagelliforme]|uniref:Peptidase C14 caspase domain-containing protein n=1 Tax=Fusarium flagelliforme TaxID=2675880 RepID=A0A395N3P0_9HYPO|nr:hypothetical protein FIE12Z_970 [Fusarium flagelliforme]
MPDGTSTTPNKWAILIGIDYYENSPRSTTNPNRLQFKSLDGCVNDACAVRQYLTDKVEVNPENITTLLAPHADCNYAYPLPPSYQEPTYANLVKALQIPKGAKPNDLIYIHYSGHGARATTIFDKNDTEGDNLLDEALVPSDVSHGGRYLRDLELGFFLNQMANAGLTVTAVLDSCHSGGGLRWSEDPHLGKTRGISDVYESDIDKDEPAIDQASEQWQEWIACRARRQHGFFALTACQASEAARERCDSVATHGLLTYLLLEILANSPTDISSQSLFTRIISNVQDSNRYQTPSYVGDRNRSFFSDELRPTVYTLTVKGDSVGLLNKHLIDRKIRLDGGSIHGVRKGSVYSIVRSHHHTDERPAETEVLAQVQVTRVETGESVARALQPESTRWSDIKAGCQAILRSLPTSKRSTVCFKVSDKSRKKTLEEDWARIDGNRTWLSLVDTHANFTVTIDKNDNFHIADDRKEFDLVVEAALNPIPSSDLPGLVYRLEHLARFNMTKRLANSRADPGAPRLIKVNIEPLQSDDDTELLPTRVGDPVSGLFEVQEGQVFRTKITNLSQRPLGCVVMGCVSEIGVHKLFPGQQSSYELEAGKSVNPRFGFGISPDFREKAVQANIPIVEVVKVFACTPSRDLSPLELKSLVHSERGDEDLSPVDLDSLLAELDTQRYVYCVPDEVLEWETEDLKFLVSPKS